MKAFIILLASLWLATTMGYGQDPSSPTQEVILSSDKPGPAVLYDGKEISQEDLALIPTAEIGDLKIYSGEQAMAKYGKYQDYGVIVVSSTANVSGSIPAEAAAADSSKEERITMSLQEVDASLILIDGASSDKKALEALAPEQIQTVEVYKGKQAVVRFGEKASGGAIIVTTKKQ